MRRHTAKTKYETASKTPATVTNTEARSARQVYIRIRGNRFYGRDNLNMARHEGNVELTIDTLKTPKISMTVERMYITPSAMEIVAS